MVRRGRAVRAAAAAAPRQQQPPPRHQLAANGYQPNPPSIAPPPIPVSFRQCYDTSNYTRVETEETMITEAKISDFDVLFNNSNKYDNNGGEQRLNSCQRALLALRREDTTGRRIAALCATMEEAQKAAYEDESSFVFCCTSCDYLFSTHQEWAQHRGTAAHKQSVRDLTTVRLMAELESIYDEAEQFARNRWDAARNPLIAVGRVAFDWGCQKHTPKQQRCPSFEAMVEVLSEDKYNDPVSRQPIRLSQRLYGFHGCRGSTALAAISCESLDPARRAAQAFGAGEYVGWSAQYSISFSGDADRLFVFLVLRSSVTSIMNASQFLVVANPHDVKLADGSVIGKARMMLPVLICMFVSNSMQAASGAAAAGQQHLHLHLNHHHNHPAAPVSQQRREMRQKRIFKEMESLRERAFADGVFAQVRPPSAEFANADNLIVDFIISPPAGSGDLAGAEICGVLQIGHEYPFECPRSVYLSPTGKVRAFVDVCIGFEQNSWSPSTTISSLLLGLLSVLCSNSGELDAAEADSFTVRRLARESRAANSRLGAFVEALRRNFESARHIGRAKAAKEEEERHLKAEKEQMEAAERKQAEMERGRLRQLVAQDMQSRQHPVVAAAPKPMPKMKPAAPVVAAAAPKKQPSDDHNVISVD